MKIGILVYGLDRPLTGIGRYTLELVRAFRALKSGLEITLLCAGNPGPLSANDDERHINLRGSRLLPSLLTWGQVAIWQQAKELNLDIVHDPTGVSPVAFANREVSTVTTIHDVFAWSLPGYSSLLDSLIYKQWLTRRWSRTDAIITVSGQSRADILEYLQPEPKKMHLVPYGVTSQFRPLEYEQIKDVVGRELDINRPYILYVGALTQRKNIVRLIHAFARIRSKHPDLLLVLAGPHSWKQTPIESVINELDLSGHVRLTGPLTDRELPALYNGALLFAFPSLYEGFGLPVLEAMACGTPVITSNISSLPDVAGDAAILVDPNNIEEIAVAMSRVLEDPALADEMRREGLQQAAKFTWERTAQETIAVYETALMRK